MQKLFIGVLDALTSLRPGAQASVLNNDYSTVQFIEPLDNPPTETEILAEVERLHNVYEQNQILKLEQKTALLERLGITEEEAKLLLS